MRQSTSHLLAIALAVTPCMPSWASGAVPLGVSPGTQSSFVQIDQRCPTFSWSGIAGAAGYELSILEEQPVEPDDPHMAPTAWVQRTAAKLPGDSRSWTPALAQCLEPGGRYAWTVRALGPGGEGDSELEAPWAEPRLFSVISAPTVEEVRAALEVLGAYIASGGDPSMAGPPPEEGGRAPAAEFELPPALAAPEGIGPTLSGLAAIRGTQTETAGDASGITGETDSVDGAGGVFANLAGPGFAGVDLLLDGSADGLTDTALNESGIDRASGDAEIFNIGNSGAGTMTVFADGVEIVTTATDQDTIYTAGNQLDLSGTTFDVVEGSGSGLDADLLDGLDSTAFLATGTDNWVDTTGDTMTGTLDLDANLDLAGVMFKDGTLFLHSTGDNNTGVGSLALSSNTSGYLNTAVGITALLSNTVAYGNTAVGAFSLRYNTEGDRNTAVGMGALLYNDDGQSNSAVGWNALRQNTTGFDNTATGAGALRNNTTGSNNTAVGQGALLRNTETSNNTAVGSFALSYNTTGKWNAAIGTEALYSNTTGFDNTALGFQALHDNTVAFLNTAVGANALSYNTEGSWNTALGAFALLDNSYGESNTALGAFAIRDNTYGIENTAVGRSALLFNTIGRDNVALGAWAMRDNVDGSSNTAVGWASLQSNQSGYSNVAIGREALLWSTSGNYNTAIGDQALRESTTGFLNTAVGPRALFDNTTGFNNTAVGVNALSTLSTGDNNPAIGLEAGTDVSGSHNILINSPGNAGESNKLRIGRGTGQGFQQLDGTFIHGILNTAITGTHAVYVDSNGQLGLNSSSRRYKRNIQDVGTTSEELLRMRPVSFEHNSDLNDTPTVQFGLIAEEVAEIMPELVVYDDSGQPQTVRYHLLAPLLLNELQRQERELAVLTERLHRLEGGRDGPP